MLFETIYYTVNRIDGDYAYLVRAGAAPGASPSAGSLAHSPEEKCVARALLPVEIAEGTKLKYEMMEYSILE